MSKGKRTKRYIVRNPRGLPASMPVIGPWREHSWYEGDDFVPLSGMKIDRLLREGYIEEVPHG